MEKVEERVQQFYRDLLKELRGKRKVSVVKEDGVYAFFISFPEKFSSRRIRKDMLSLRSRLYQKHRELLDRVCILVNRE